MHYSVSVSNIDRRRWLDLTVKSHSSLTPNLTINGPTSIVYFTHARTHACTHAMDNSSDWV